MICNAQKTNFTTKMAANVAVQQAAIEITVADTIKTMAGGGISTRPIGVVDISQHIAEYDVANGEKTAHYMLRWVESGGEKGPWSETVSATISA